MKFIQPRNEDDFFEVRDKLRELAMNQVELDDIAKRVLYENLWNLYT